MNVGVKILNKTLSNWVHIERIIHIDQVGLIPGIEWCFNIKNIYIYDLLHK